MRKRQWRISRSICAADRNDREHRRSDKAEGAWFMLLFVIDGREVPVHGEEENAFYLQSEGW